MDPLSIDFGAIPAGSTSATQIVTVTNVGDAPLGITHVRLADRTAPFSLTEVGSSLLAPGDATTFLVAFEPGLPGGATGEVEVSTNDPDDPVVVVTLSGEGQAPDIVVDPVAHDFGTLEYGVVASLDVTVRNDGLSDLSVTDILYSTVSTELTMRATGAPFTLSPGQLTVVTVDYAPTDANPDEGFVTVYSDDPDEPEAIATQIGNARAWEGFSTGWYIVDDSTNYETTSNASRTVETYGDPDGYWYEPSGAHGLVDSADPDADFLVMHDYVIARAGAPTPVTAPLTFRTVSSIPAMTYASYSYILCDFWIEGTDDPNLYEVRAGTVDDGAQVMVNGEIVANWYLGAAGSVNIGAAIHPGEVNTLVVLLMDNSAVDKYLTDLAFYRDGVFVSGE